MKSWNKKEVSREVVKELTEKYGIDPITASILIRRGILDGTEIQYFVEKDKRFLHSPFEFANMTDAVERILQAQEEGEKVLIFGDKDVDGITSTTVLYNCLKEMGIDVRWQLPGATDPYGLNIPAVENFAKDYGTLIITVDCGISNNSEIEYAASLGIDVIVVDHHNPPEQLPNPAIIINPKCADSGYPFKDISGCAVAYKLCCALRFSKSELYRNEVCLLTIRPVNDAYAIDCIKTENLVETDSISETIIPGTLKFGQTRLASFLKGVQIFVWDAKTTQKMLTEIFGTGIEFGLTDLQPEVAKLFPQLGSLSLMRVKAMSRIARYNPKYATEIQGFFNIFVTFMNNIYYSQFKSHALAEEQDLQLVGLAALADIMPLRNENRIFLKQALTAINSGKCRDGLKELLCALSLYGKRISSGELSWNVCPVLNSCGRLGKPEIGVNLFTDITPENASAKTSQIYELNEQRKKLGDEGWLYALEQSDKTLEKYNNKLVVVVDERINRGLAGIIAGKLVSKYKVPGMAITFVDDVATGSMRSCRGFNTTVFLDQMSDIFINHGGHNQAAGFSFKKSKLNEFLKRLELLAPAIELDQETDETFDIDAEIPASYLTPKLIDIVDMFEPYGEQNKRLLFMTRGLRILDARLIGKGDPMSVKLTLDAKASKWPGLYWGAGNLLKQEFDKGDYVDILYELERNTYNGVETLQLKIIDLKRSE